MVKQEQRNALVEMAQSSMTSSVKGRSPWRDAYIRFWRNKAAVLSVFVLAVIVLACMVVPSLSPHKLIDSDWGAMSTPPTLQNWHYFGVDDEGRDLLVMSMHGGRVSILIGLLATLTSVVVGVIWGSVAGFVGGRVDSVMMRIVDMMYAIPYLLIAILFVTLFGVRFSEIFGNQFGLVVIAITVFSWMDMARVVRGQTLSIKSKEFIEAARAIGVPTWKIVMRHIVPNLLGVVVIYTSITIPGVILTESVLSVLGLGVQFPDSSWGSMIGNGIQKLELAPYILLVPATLLTITLYCFNYIGDGLRDALDPKDR
ncbi:MULTISPECIES: ABC transporter permease [Leeia]|uniref:Oligopeptide transport system permease protein OppC n=1 Tax=Leeia aquatica TaxID=2725557 RepID=A0A847SB58_9NEIS|nr:ABC transporter permease subunit [Leeia aquatica]NLR74766.1 ABC transporter permease subunit [Leeia aquatica]